MSKSSTVYLVCLLVLSNFVVSHGDRGTGLISKEECDRVGAVEIRYNEFFELYLGRRLGSDKLEENGIVYNSLTKAVGACCPGMDLNFTLITNQTIETLVQDDILHNHKKTNETHHIFYFPEFTEQGQLDVYSYRIPFVKLRKSPGLALVMLASESHLNVNAADVILPSWPIFALIISLSWAVGILCWALDSLSNPEEFPRPFLRGMFDGFWWAIVTMSTVGYGDKAPKSVLARLLCVIWIAVGAVLLSLFTANTTSIITTNRIEKNAETMGKKIGVVKMRAFVESQLNLGAQIIEFYRVKTALEALSKKTIDRVLFPHYLDLLYWMSTATNHTILSKLYVAKVFDKPFQIGMVLSHINASTARNNLFYTCLEIKSTQFSRESPIDYSNIDESIANGESNTFDTEVSLQLLYIILGVIGLMIFLGIVFDLYVFFRKRPKQRPNPGHQLSSGVV